MKKISKLLIIVIAFVLLIGCGNKSNAELTDVDKNNIQDSSETEFLSSEESITEENSFDEEDNQVEIAKDIYAQLDISGDIPIINLKYDCPEYIIQSVVYNWVQIKLFTYCSNGGVIDDFIIRNDIDGDVFEIQYSKANELETLDDFYLLFPEEWRETFSKSITQIGDIKREDVEKLIVQHIINPIISKYSTVETQEEEIEEKRELEKSEVIKSKDYDVAGDKYSIELSKKNEELYLLLVIEAENANSFLYNSVYLNELKSDEEFGKMNISYWIQNTDIGTIFSTNYFFVFMDSNGDLKKSEEIIEIIMKSDSYDSDYNEDEHIDSYKNMLLDFFELE